jgi:hypothetical protein
MLHGLAEENVGEYMTQAVEANSRAISFDLSDMCKMSAIIYWYDMYQRVCKCMEVVFQESVPAHSK